MDVISSTLPLVGAMCSKLTGHPWHAGALILPMIDIFRWAGCFCVPNTLRCHRPSSACCTVHEWEKSQPRKGSQSSKYWNYPLKLWAWAQAWMSFWPFDLMTIFWPCLLLLWKERGEHSMSPQICHYLFVMNQCHWILNLRPSRCTHLMSKDTSYLLTFPNGLANSKSVIFVLWQ